MRNSEDVLEDTLNYCRAMNATPEELTMDIAEVLLEYIRELQYKVDYLEREVEVLSRD